MTTDVESKLKSFRMLLEEQALLLKKLELILAQLEKTLRDAG